MVLMFGACNQLCWPERQTMYKVKLLLGKTQTKIDTTLRLFVSWLSADSTVCWYW